MFHIVVLLWTWTLTVFYGCSRTTNNSPLISQGDTANPSPIREENAHQPIATTEETTRKQSRKDTEGVEERFIPQLYPASMLNTPIQTNEVRYSFSLACNGPRRPRGYAHLSIVRSGSSSTGMERRSHIVCNNGQDKLYKTTVVNRRCPDEGGEYWLQLEREVDEFCHASEAQEDPSYRSGEIFGRFEVHGLQDDFQRREDLQRVVLEASVCDVLGEDAVGDFVAIITASDGLEIHGSCTGGVHRYRSQSPWIRQCPSTSSLRAKLRALCPPAYQGPTPVPSHEESGSGASRSNEGPSLEGPQLQQSELLDEGFVNRTPIASLEVRRLECNGPRRPRGYAYWLLLESASTSGAADRIAKIVCSNGSERDIKTTSVFICPFENGFVWSQLEKEIDGFCARNEAPEDLNYRRLESFGAFRVTATPNEAMQNQDVCRTVCSEWTEAGLGNASVFITESSGLEIHAFCAGDGQSYRSQSPWIRECPHNASLRAPLRALCTPPNTTEDEDNKCPICHDSLKSTQESGIARELNCRHAFHIGCISRWLTQKRNCPVCREPQEQLFD